MRKQLFDILTNQLACKVGCKVTKSPRVFKLLSREQTV